MLTRESMEAAAEVIYAAWLPGGWSPGLPRWTDLPSGDRKREDALRVAFDVLVAVRRAEGDRRTEPGTREKPPTP